jgi:hypothetical protein
MNFVPGKFAVALAGGLFLACLAPALAQNQNPEQKQSEKGPTAEEQAREAQLRAMQEFAEAAKLPKNAGQPECLWLGRRVTSLLWRDDPDAAKRFIEMYDRFNCPGEHLKLAFRCVVRMGPMDQKATQKLAARVHMCWVNPETHPH